MTVIPKDKGSERDEQLGQWRVHVDKVLRFDVSAGEFAKVDLVEAVDIRAQ